MIPTGFGFYWTVSAQFLLGELSFITLSSEVLTLFIKAASDLYLRRGHLLNVGIAGMQ